MNKSKDKIMKEFLENNAYFVDFFNAYFFGGERVLKPENCMELDSEMNDSNMDLEKHVDVIRNGSLTLAHSRNSQMSFMYGFFFVKFLFFTVVCVVIVI